MTSVSSFNASKDFSAVRFNALFYGEESNIMGGLCSYLPSRG
jgi:hypothetical protein